MIAAGVDPSLVAKKKHGADASWQEIDEKEYPGFVADRDGCVIGGTAWDFANAGRVPRGSLDLLVVEEAGQYSLANTIAVASAAKNVLLLGDPQQLPQVSQGTHPEPVDTSALGWLIDGRHTLPAELGYFLDRSYRMHPDVCAAVSRLSYDDRLQSVDELTGARTTRRTAARRAGADRRPRRQFDGQPGRGGRHRRRDREADRRRVERRARASHRWSRTTSSSSRRTTRRSCCCATGSTPRGCESVRAGTVDKFQGQQAPVVFVSMTASSIDDVPRGIAFLLNRNRLNVAVSRAKYLSVIVRSPLLTEYLPSTPDRLIELGAFLSLPSCGTPTG